HGLRQHPRSAVRARLPDVVGRRERVVPDRPEHRRGELRARVAGAEAVGRAVQECRRARHPADSQSGQPGGEQREGDRDDASGARARRPAPRRRTQASRRRHVDELPRHPGAARPRAGEDERAERDSRLRSLARRLRSAAGSGSGGRDGGLEWITERIGRQQYDAVAGPGRGPRGPRDRRQFHSGRAAAAVTRARHGGERVWRARKNYTWLDAEIPTSDAGVELQFFYDGSLVLSRTWPRREDAVAHANQQLRGLQRAGWNAHW